ncbi:MAG: sn-glycerol-3-phosphate ABC transporter ATP-binding protein UgpC [Candidatus Latescibacterota bacterium]|nr:sn-glycerol-3-phosphate ABC transporter ATP-binding protein UgpC [Candidatus Latescibacterota bacterium]
MAEVILKNIRKVYDKDVVAVDSADIEIKDKEFVVLVGPSGCGKSTTLRMIAGLEEITDGEISIDGAVVNDMPPKDRDIAMVFQNYALYPHMTVYQNMAFGLKLRKYPKDEIEARVQEAAEILGIQELLERKPKALSGGQRQRVAVGRAIVRKPKVFLFDEPLSNLDAKLRVQMRAEISKLHTQLEATMVYVTHDQIEAMTMGDRIVVMRDGLIQQIDEPLILYNKPVNRFVAGFIGSPSMNFVRGKLTSNGRGATFDEGQVQIALSAAQADQLRDHFDREVTLGIRPEDIHDPETIGRNIETVEIEANVEVVEPMGNEVFLNLTTGTTTFVARIDQLNIPQVDQTVQLSIEVAKAHFFDLDSEESLLQR